jgi:hypothetical protein
MGSGFREFSESTHKMYGVSYTTGPRTGEKRNRETKKLDERTAKRGRKQGKGEEQD